MNREGRIGPSGTLGLRVFRGDGRTEDITAFEEARWPAPLWLSARDLLRYGAPSQDLPEAVNAWRAENLQRLLLPFARLSIARRLRLPHFAGRLWLRVFRANGDIEELGLASLRVVTTVGVNYLVDALQNLTEPENLKFHGLGTGTNAEAVGDTALQTELTTQYNPDNTRATGSLTEGASGNIFRTVGTNTVDASAAVTEHGILSQAATGGGTLLDRSVFSVVNLANGDSLQSTYDLTIAAGS